MLSKIVFLYKCISWVVIYSHLHHYHESGKSEERFSRVQELPAQSKY